MVQSLAKDYEGRVEVKIYTVGKDFDYIAKYGPVSKSMLIVNERRAIQKLSKGVVREAFEEAIQGA